MRLRLLFSIAFSSSGATCEMVGYLTPDDVPAEQICRVILIPNSEAWIAVVTGALNSLAEAQNWQPQGVLTPEEAAAAWLPHFDDYCFQTFTCEGRVIGEIVCTAGSSNPSPNWLSCDGTSLLRSNYPGLFAVIGTTYGAVDGSHFNLPDLRGRAGIGSGQGTGLTNRPLGTAPGAETHQLSVGEMPAHAHTDTGHAHGYVPAVAAAATIAPGAPFAYSVPGAAATGVAGAVLTNTGGGLAHNNMQPSLALSYWIVAQ